MKPATFAAAPAPAPATESQWVEAELVRGAMRNTASTQLALLPVILVFVGVLWDETPAPALVAWALLVLVTGVARHLLLRHYERHVRGLAPARVLAFYQRARHLWTLSAVLWGASVWLFFDRTPLASQFICWLLLWGIALFSVNMLSSHLPTLRLYVNGMMLVALALVGWRVVVELRLQGPYYHFWVMILLLLFWQVLLQAGRSLYLTHRRNFELQFRNGQLIESLTRQTQAALEAIETKNRFLASATHDIRQPVHALGLYADWLASEPELVGELAPKIVESTKAVNTLFDSLFDLVRLDSGNIHLNIEDVPLDRLLSELEVQYRPLAQAKGLTLRVRPARGSSRSDALLLRRIVGNLISNAIKYTERGGVLVAVRWTGAVPRVEVWDTGVGIAPQHQDEIFREFYKVPAHAGTEEGFGLGLNIVSRLSQILGHRVSLTSRPGRGTVFRLLLTPTDPVQAQARAAALAVGTRRGVAVG